MQQPDARKYLFDIQKACRLIEQFVAGKAGERVYTFGVD
jgi:hypothetical protein